MSQCVRSMLCAHTCMHMHMQTLDGASLVIAHLLMERTVPLRSEEEAKWVRSLVSGHMLVSFMPLMTLHLSTYQQNNSVLLFCGLKQS